MICYIEISDELREVKEGLEAKCLQIIERDYQYNRTYIVPLFFNG